jgi:hypothetical protein
MNQDFKDLRDNAIVVIAIFFPITTLLVIDAIFNH